MQGQDVPPHNLHVSGAGELPLEVTGQVVVQFYGEDASGLGDQIAGESAQPGADLDHYVIGLWIQGEQHLTEGGLAGEEVLPQALPGGERNRRPGAKPSG